MAVRISSAATVFIQVWVDLNAVQKGSTKGVYLVDNRLGQGSSGEGSATLASEVSVGSTIQWNVYDIDPNGQATLSIQSIGAAPVWGAGGQPGPDGHGGFIGQALAAGTAPYALTLSIQKPQGPTIVTTVNPTLSSR